MDRILFFNTGWMESYEGLENDTIKGGGSYIKEYNSGGEIYNFLKINEKVYGYVQTVRGSDISITKVIGNNEDKAEHVLLVFTATSPQGGSFIVGWYKDATIYKTYQKEFNHTLPNGKKINKMWISEAEYKNATLLNVDDRTLQVPIGKGGKGESNVWYAQAERGLEFRKKVLQFIKQYDSRKIQTLKKRTKLTTDIEKNKEVESIAIQYILNLYKKQGYTVTSVEKDNVGWDLEARFGRKLLRIEVKGRGGSTLDAQLSRNEYEKMKQYKEDGYRLAIVMNCFKVPTQYIFMYNREKDKWCEKDDASLVLDINEIVLARASIKSN